MKRHIFTNIVLELLMLYLFIPPILPCHISTVLYFIIYPMVRIIQHLVLHIDIFFKRFIYFYLKHRFTGRSRDKVFHLLLHSTSGCDGKN